MALIVCVLSLKLLWAGCLAFSVFRVFGLRIAKGRYWRRQLALCGAPMQGVVCKAPLISEWVV
jgi:hypothetical protein